VAKSQNSGATTSDIEVASISRHGFWLNLDGRELFVSFKEFPWFAEAPVNRVVDVRRPSPDHLYWPDLDVDLSIESIEHPERFVLRFDSFGSASAKK
jgi:Protein of unknown function (DUF2442)